MAKVRQLQVKYVGVEDRLLLRVSSDSNSEFRFWLTRRYTQRMLQALELALQQTPGIQAHASADAQQAIIEFERGKVVDNADFKTPFKDQNNDLPLGDAPTLLSKLQVRRGKNGIHVINLAPHQGQGIDLALESQLLHALIVLLQKGIDSADWKLRAPTAVIPSEALPENATIN